MARLSWQIGGLVPDEEAGFMVMRDIESLMFWRDLARFTGLREKAVDVGWSWGFHHEFHPFEECDQHARHVRDILSVPVVSIVFRDLMEVWEMESHDLYHLWGRWAGQPLDDEVISGEDGLIEIYGEPADLANLAAALVFVRPEHYAKHLCRIEETEKRKKERDAERADPEASRYRLNGLREEEEAERARDRALCVYLPWGYQDYGDIYGTPKSGGFFMDLAKAWKLTRGWSWWR